MNSLRTKKKLKTRMSWWLPLVFLCLSVLFFSYTVTQFWFAAETDPENPAGDTNPETPSEDTTPAYSEDPNYLVDWDYIVVTWVANTVEYLTSLYLYVTDPKSSTSVNMKYDPDLNALLINSSINANAMGIWFNEFWEWVAWSVFVWWSWNKITMRGQEILDEYWDYTWTRNGKNDSAVAIWWISNRPSSAWSVIVWWKNNSIWFSDSTMIWAVDSSLNGHQSVALWSRKSSLNVQDWNSVDMWYNNHWVKFTYLIWSWITTHWWSHWSAAVSSIFAYSPGNSGFELQGWNLWWQPWFYVNVKNGFWLNTSTPRLTFDFRSAGPLRVVPALWVQNNTMQFSEWAADGITCPDEVIVEKFRWTVAYVQSGWIWAFCWCNGKVWMPMSSDANEQALCAESKADARVCEGDLDEKTVIFHEETKWKPRWDEDANEWRWEWINLNWTFMWVPSLNSTDERECSYTCAVWYHPDNKSAKWWFTGNCVPCSELKFWEYISPGTGVNDCEFACAWWYKYDKWAKTDDGRCTPCRPWEWTENLNQAMLCNKCELPVWISAKTPLLTWWMVFNWWTMWNWTTWTWEPYFSWFIKFSTSGEYGCDFECASWYMYSYDGTETGNKCIECGIWTYSPWWQYPWEAWGKCADCTNRVQNSISFSYTDVKGKTYSWTIAAKDLSWYTTKWKNWPNSCEWICNPSMWLIKDGKSCRCPDNSHMELVAGKPKCVANIADLPCEGEISPLAIRWAPLAKWVSAWTLVWNNWKAKSVSWTYVSNNPAPASLGACEWTCPEDYELDPVTNDCKHPTLGKCGAKNWKLVDSLSVSDLCDTNLWYGGFTTLSDEIEINYYVGNKFIYYPPTGLITNSAKYLAIWTCKWYEWKPQYDGACFAYVKWEAKRAQCPGEGEWRDASGKAQAKCVYDTPNNCKENLNCPPVENKQDVDKVIKEPTIDLDNVLPHWLMWTCPGTFWWDPTACHSCDSGYSWWVARWGCTEDVITTHCKGTDLPSSRSNTNFYDETYTNRFDKSIDNYTPWILQYNRLPDWANPTSPCEWACEADTHYCGSICEPNPRCWSLNVDGSWNIIEDDLCPSWNSPSSVTTGSDGAYHWTCHRWCMDSEDCWGNKYTCLGTAKPHTVYVGEHYLLDSPAWYELYPDDSPHLWEPCSLKCAEGYVYNPATNSCEEVNPPKCWEPNKKIWDWRSSPEYCNAVYPRLSLNECLETRCTAVFQAWTENYYKCKAKGIYKYCDEWEVRDFTRWNFLGASWSCVVWENSVDCSAGCSPWTDNADPHSLCLGSKDTNDDSIFVPHGKTFTFSTDAPWLTISRDETSWLSGWWMMHYSAPANTWASRSALVSFTTNDDNFCSDWQLTIWQCWVGEENIRDGDSCRCGPIEGWYSCPSASIPHAVALWPRDNLSVQPTGNKLYETEREARMNPCWFVCEEDYTFLHASWTDPDRCEICDEWTLNEDKTYCVITVDCSQFGSDYIPDGNWNCIKMWNCEGSLFNYVNVLPEHAVGNINDILPINGNLKWSCKSNQSSVTPHACEYSCEEGYYCYWTYSCDAPFCDYKFDSRFKDPELTVTYANPTANLVNQNWWRAGIWWEFLPATDLEDFKSQVYDEHGNKKMEGCFYRCPKGVDPTGIYPKCNDADDDPNAYTCIGSLDGVEDENIITTPEDVILEDGNKKWDFVKTKAEYDTRVANGEQCLYRCKDGFTRHTYSWWDLCTQTCKPDEFLNSKWICKNCYREDEIPNTGTMQNGNAVECKSRCNLEIENWSTTYKKCVLKSVNTTTCPDGYEILGRDPETSSLICWKKFG